MDAFSLSLSEHRQRARHDLGVRRAGLGRVLGVGPGRKCGMFAVVYVHSTIIQERRNMFRVWNVVLICITFLLTIFGTFLTRSGLIASVHSFAKSDIGPFFSWFLVFTAV